MTGGWRWRWRRNRVLEEALAWLARLKRGLHEQEGPELLQWLRRSQRRRRTIARAAAQWHGPEVLAVLSAIYPIDPRMLQPPKPRAHLYIFGALLLFQLSVLLPKVIGQVSHYMPGLLTSSRFSESPFEDLGDIYVTAPGATRQVRLEDGSRLQLNGGTRVAVYYAEYIRSVYVSRGEVLFNVVGAPHRPFHVHVAGRDLDEDRAAMYDIRVKSPVEMELVVISGGVTVLAAPRAAVADTAASRRDGRDQEVYSTEPLWMGPLEMLVTRPGSQSSYTLTAQDLDTRLAWRKRMQP